MNCLIYDIDGVLNGHEWCHGRRGPYLNQHNVEVFNHIVRTVRDLRSVLTSQWRGRIHSGTVPTVDFEWMLSVAGVEKHNLTGIVPYNSDPNTRGQLIVEWVRKNTDPGDRICVIDDLPLPEISQAVHVRPNPAVGLEWYHAKQVLDIFNNPAIHLHWHPNIGVEDNG